MYVSRCASVLLLVAGSHAVAATPTLRLQDAICVPGNQVRLTGEVSSNITLSLHDGKSNLNVEFFADGRSLGSAVTNSKGIAVLETDSQRIRSNTYTARTTYKGQALRAEGRWFNWRSDRTVIAVDIDDTVCHTNYADLFMSDRDKVSKPYKGAAPTLRHLSQDFYVLYLSARPLWLTDKTRQWLDQNGFPAGPVVHRGGWESCLRQEAVKREIIASLRPILPNLMIAIADRDVDIRAFGSEGMVTALMRNPHLARGHERVLGFNGWSSLGRYFAQHSVDLADAHALTSALEHNKLAPHIDEPIDPADAAADASEPDDALPDATKTQ